jgi:chromosome partitioning protein
MNRFLTVASQEWSMPTVVFMSPKGGAGKTTSALLFSLALARLYDVTIIDADPNRPIQKWALGGNTPQRLRIVSDAGEEDIMERIAAAASETAFVVVDLEGTAAMIAVYAVSQADFVIIPTQSSQLDADEASKAIRVVHQSEKLTGRAKPYTVLWTRTSTLIPTRGQRHIEKGLVAAGIPVMKTQLHEREAFRSVFSFRQTLDDLNPSEVPNLDKAKLNVWEFVSEIIARIKAELDSREEDIETQTEQGAA